MQESSDPTGRPTQKTKIEEPQEKEWGGAGFPQIYTLPESLGLFILKSDEPLRHVYCETGQPSEGLRERLFSEQKPNLKTQVQSKSLQYWETKSSKPDLPFKKRKKKRKKKKRKNEGKKAWPGESAEIVTLP